MINHIKLAAISWLLFIQFFILARLLIWILPNVNVFILLIGAALIVLFAEKKVNYTSTIFKTDRKTLYESIRADLRNAGKRDIVLSLLAHIIFMGLLYWCGFIISFLLVFYDSLQIEKYDMMAYNSPYQREALFILIGGGVVSGFLDFISNLAKARSIKWLPFVAYPASFLLFLVS